MFAQIINVLKDQHYPAIMVVDNCRQASLKCKCGRLSCPACGMVKFVNRVNRVSEKIHHAKAIA